MSGLVLLPFILKPILGLIADSMEIKRKIAIAVGLVVAAVSFASAASVDPNQKFFLFSVLMMMASLGVAIFDTIADALAVDAFDNEDFGSLQSAMLAGKSLGLILFSVIFGILIDSVGYHDVFIFLGLAMLVPFVVWSGVKHVPRKEPFKWTAFRVLIQKKIVWIALFGVVYSIPSFGVSGLFSYYFSKMGMGATQVGWLEATRSIGAVVGALMFAGLIRRFELRTIAIFATFAALLVSVAVPWQSSNAYFYVILSLFGIIWALRETVYTTIAISVTDPAIAATMFSLLMAVSNLGTSIGETWATAMAGRQGFETTFVWFGLLNLLSLFYFYRRRKGFDFKKT